MSITWLPMSVPLPPPETALFSRQVTGMGRVQAVVVEEVAAEVDDLADAAGRDHRRAKPAAGHLR